MCDVPLDLQRRFEQRRAARFRRPVSPIPKAIPMRILALAILAIGTVSTGPAAAQKYDPAYPVCLHAYGLAGFNYYDCSYTSLPQCNASASGRAAQCDINPYFAGAEEPRERHYRRHPRVY